MTALTAKLAAFGLHGHQSISAEPLPDEAWERLLIDVRRERIEGLLAAAVHDRALAVTPAQQDAIRKESRSRAGVDLFLERELLGVGDHFTSEGVAFRVLKGLAWSHTTYPDPSWRGTGDVDLLVATKDWYRAVRLLEDLGMRRATPELRPGFDVRFGKDATLDTHTGWEVDLHRVLVLGPYGLWVDEPSLMAGIAVLRVGGLDLPSLDPPRSFIHACYNAVLADDPPRLIALRDVAQMAVGQVDPVAVRSLARRWRSERVVAVAIRRSEAVLGISLSSTPIGTEFGAVRFRVRDRALLACYRGPERGFTSQAAGVIAVPGLRARAAYLAALGRPDNAYLRSRGWRSSSPLRQGLSRAWHRRRGTDRTSRPERART